MHDYCRDLVRSQDYNRYLLTFFVPRDKRLDILTLFTLNIELESIPTKVTDPNVALIRLQWWRDSLKTIYKGDTPDKSPVLTPLSETIKAHKLTNDNFDPLFDCYEGIIRGTPADPSEILYNICGDIIQEKKAIDRFSKILFHHDCLDDNTPFRALRLWLGV